MKTQDGDRNSGEIASVSQRTQAGEVSRVSGVHEPCDASPKSLFASVDAEIPPSDPYSDFIAENPWRAWALGLFVMIFFSMIGISVAYGARGGFSVGNGSVGFEARNSTLAGKILPLQNIKNMECINELALVADGTGSKFYQDQFDPDKENNGIYYEYTECYSGYVDSMDDDRDSRRRARRLDWGDYGEDNFDPELVSVGNTYAVATGSKTGISVVYKGPDLFQLDAIQSMCEVDKHIQGNLGRTWTSTLCIPYTYSDGTSACIPSRSLGNYVTALANATSCASLSEGDVQSVKALLLTCRPLYDNGSLKGNCWNFANGTYTDKYLIDSSLDECSLIGDVEQECARYNAIYDIFYSLSKSAWLSGGVESPLDYSQLIMVNEEKQAVLLDAWFSTIEPIVGNTYPGEVTIVAADTQGNTRGALLNALIGSQMAMVVFIFVIVYFLILYHTGSFWITSCGFLQIFMAFLWGFTLYTVVLWRQFFPFLNLVSLFLIIGIGADDLFVFIDAWKQSFSIIPAVTPLANRLSWTMRRAGSAMLVTTITTTASFMANIVSPITSLKGFGLFTALVIFSDFLLMLVFVPATIAVHYTTFSVGAGQMQLLFGRNPAWNNDGCPQLGCPLPFRDIHETCSDPTARTSEDEESGPAERSCDSWDDTRSGTDYEGKESSRYEDTSKKKMAVDDTSSTLLKRSQPIVSSSEKNHELHLGGNDNTNMVAQTCCCMNCCCCVTSCDIDFCAVPTELEVGGKKVKQRWSEDLFEFYIAPVIVHPYMRYFFLGVCLAMTAWLLTHAMKLRTPSTDYMQLLYADHPIEQYKKVYVHYFDIGTGTNFNRPYYFVFGIAPIDNGDPFDPYNRGELMYTHMDLSSGDSQGWLLNFCDSISGWDKTSQSSSDLSTNVCTMYWFKQWMEYDCSLAGIADSTQSSLAYMPADRSTNTCCGMVESDFPYNSDTFNTCIKTFANYWGNPDRNYNHGLWFDLHGNLKIMIVEGQSNTEFSWEYDLTKTFYSEIVDFFSSSSATPSGLKNNFASTEITFFALQEAIAKGAFESAGLSTILAVIVLLLMTRRVISSIFAAFEILCVVVSVTGVFVILGWELNVTESVVFSLSVGLACDFAAHLAHSYNHVVYDDEENVPFRFPRSVEELNVHLKMSYYQSVRGMTELGVTVALGGLTTFLAGVILLTGTVYFFQQFGTFLSLLMSFSFAYAMLLLMPLLASMGWMDRILARKIALWRETFRVVIVGDDTDIKIEAETELTSTNRANT